MRTVLAAVLALSGQAWAQAQLTREIQKVKEATVFAHWEYANNLGGITYVDVIASRGPAPRGQPFSASRSFRPMPRAPRSSPPQMSRP